MTLETVRALSDAELSQVAVRAGQEIEARREKRKQETIAKIKELAGAVGVAVSIKGQRGRPAKSKPEAKPVKKAGPAGTAKPA